MKRIRVFEHSEYRDDVAYVSNLNLPWFKLYGKSILISGATGLIGSFLIDVLLKKNEEGLDCSIYALGRNEERARKRFDYCFEKFCFIQHDINKMLIKTEIGLVDYVLHLASNTHPVAYSTDPIGTIMTNIIGTQNMLEFSLAHHATRFAFASSNEIYGENRGDVEVFDEHYCGYIDSNTLRAGYPESKRCGEALCQAYIRQKNLDIVIPRLTRSYGPTMLKSDSKVINQFISKGVDGDDIILKSAGTQFYSYTYVADAVAGLLTVLLAGEKGEAYNISDTRTDMMLKDIAIIIGELTGNKVVYQQPDAIEAAGYSKATKARLDGRKLQKLGWTAKYDLKNGLKRTISILRSCW